MSYFYKQNFGYGTLNGAINNSVTTLTLNAGHNFSLVTTNVSRVIIWDAITYPNPADDPNLEIVTFNYSGSLNVYTIARAQEGTAAVSHGSGAAVAMTITAGVITSDLNNAAVQLAPVYLFQYQGQVDQQGISQGEYIANSLNPSGATGVYRFLQAHNSGYEQIWTTKFIKTSGISTVTVKARIWCRTASSQTANIQVDIGGQNNNVNGTANNNVPEWVSFTIDVSSLTNGNTYDVTASLKDSQTNGGIVYCANIIGFGS